MSACIIVLHKQILLMLLKLSRCKNVSIDINLMVGRLGFGACMYFGHVFFLPCYPYNYVPIAILFFLILFAARHETLARNNPGSLICFGLLPCRQAKQKAYLILLTSLSSYPYREIGNIFLNKNIIGL